MNYKHLHYFWIIAKTGSIVRASEQLHLTPQTISGQLSKLEEDFGTRLFTRRGRNLLLNDAGRLVYDYAKDIFALGAELEDTIRSFPANPPQLFKVGVADVIPKTIAYHLLRPALLLPQAVHIDCQEGKLTDLLSDLAMHKISLIISDSPIPKTLHIKCFNHKLGESGITFFAARKLANIFKGELPGLLDRAPMLLPNKQSSIRNKLLQWLDENQVQPNIVGEFDDSALMKTFGRSGAGIFIGPTVIETEIAHQYSVEIVGRTDVVMDQFYAISVERKLKHPAVVAITQSARSELFN